MNVACLFILMKNLLVVKFFSEWQFSVRPLNGLAQVWQKCEVWSFFMATWRHHYDIIIMTSSSLRHHQLRRYLYNTLERMSTRREQIDLDHVLVNGDRRDWSDEIIKSTMPAACKRISNTEFKVIGGLRLESKYRSEGFKKFIWKKLSLGPKYCLNLWRPHHIEFDFPIWRGRQRCQQYLTPRDLYDFWFEWFRVFSVGKCLLTCL